MESGGHGTRVLVPSELLQRAANEVGAYGAENVGWPPKVSAPPRRSDGVVGAGYYVFVVVLMHSFALYQAFGLDWRGEGRLVAADVRAGHSRP